MVPEKSIDTLAMQRLKQVRSEHEVSRLGHVQPEETRNSIGRDVEVRLKGLMTTQALSRDMDSRMAGDISSKLNESARPKRFQLAR